MNRSSQLLHNTLILSVGTVGSKLIQYLLLPYYTTVLTTAEYGVADNLQNVAFLLIPAVSLTLSEAIFRYGMDKHHDPKAVFSNGNILNLLCAVVAAGITLIAALLIRRREALTYLLTVAGYVCIHMFRTNCSMYVKAIHKTLLFTIDNVVLAAVTVVANVLFLSVGRLGAVGYMLGYIVGNAVSALFLIVTARLYRHFSFARFSAPLCRALLLFSIPLIPNTVCWWISNSSNRFMISHYVGVEENGLFAIAYKVPTVITIVVGILLQAWQISANEAAEDSRLKTYYTHMYDALDAAVAILCSVAALSARLLVSLMATDAYAAAWRYVPLLAAAVYFYSKAQLLGTVYTTFKKTGMAFVTNLTAAVVNVVFNLLLIRAWHSALGAATATCISYAVLYGVRRWDTRKHLSLSTPLLREGVTALLLVTQAVLLTWFDGYGYLSVACLAVLVALHGGTLLRVAGKVLRR